MKKPVFFGLFLSMSLHAAAQNGNSDNFQKMVDFLPPAPNAAAIIKHEALSINKNNGSPSFNIPIFTVKGNKLAANISIGYSSTGIKVDEIASRVGMGWALNAGGVVTRTVRGAVDEWNTRIAPYLEPIQPNCGNWNFMNNAFSSMSCNASGCNGWDAEPDLFNFNMNGQSGSFVYDGNGNPVLIPAEKFKIQKNLNGTEWNFIITDNQGIEYYFGGTGAVEKTKRLSNCGKTYDSYIANTWYLVKIKHPNGEAITFTYLPHNYEYDNGVSQTFHWTNPQVDMDAPPNSSVGCPSGDCPPAPSPTKCVNRTSTQGVLLNNITCNNDIVNFQYETRMDCTDKLVSQIRHYNNNEHIETVNFFYDQRAANALYLNETNGSYNNYTPYLTDLQRLSSDLALANTHRFVYNDPEGRPPRLSFSQDHWGYFNGIVNTSFIPRHTDPLLTYKFPNATANREPDPAFASKGMLTKIVYPTGGIDQITYESNEVNDQISGPAAYETYHEYSCNVTGTGFPTPVLQTKSTSFTITKAQVVEIIISCGTSNPGGYDEIHMKGYLSITGGPVNIPDEYFLAGSPAIQYTRHYLQYNYLPAGTYTVTYGAKGRDQTTSIKLKFYPTSTASNNTNKIIGGVRVKRIMTGNPNEKPTIRRFYYANMETLSQSSMSSTQWPKYDKNYRNTVSGCVVSNGSNTGPWQAYCDLTAMYSGSLVSLFNYGSGLISYGSVIESIGENFEGGATQTKFNVGPDGRGQVIWGNDILEAPLTNFSSLLNGKVHEEIVFKKPAGTGPLFPIKKTQYTYMLDQRQQQILYGYNINKKYNIQLGVPGNNCSPATGVDERIMAFDVVKYWIMSYWTHPETVTETIYDENGQNPITTVNNSFFDNDQHFQLTRSETINSKSELLKTVNTYPPDHTGTVYTAMTAKNIITPLVTSTSKNGNSELSLNKINYGDVGNNNFVPVSVEKSVKGNTPEIEGTIDQYDANGNILQFTGKNGVVTAIIWGYNYKYPVAQVVGATYANAIAQLSTPGSVATIQSMDGTTLRTELHRIRTGITAASVTTYTYKIMTGVTSITDPNNKTNTYDYDSFNRLMIIKDQDGNVVKKNEYQYVTSSASSVLGVFFSAARTKDYQCQTCASGYTDNTVYHYYIPYGKYYSLTDQAAADAQAAADTEGQEYANKNGKCVNYVTATCIGDAFKVINCICEEGIKECLGSIVVSGGWLVNMRYKWSDGSTGPPFTEFLATCNGADRKFLNCICEKAEKVCETVVNNGGGSYTVTWHYKWSDNSISTPSTVETITCSGIDKKIINCACKTAEKIYVTSEFCGLGSNLPGCCNHMWRCGFYYRWSDNSTLGDINNLFYECAAESCMPIAEK